MKRGRKMNAILYICHGSRVKEASDQAVSFVRKIMKKVDTPIQEVGFLELSHPTVSQSFEHCVNQGATNIIVIPILLLTAAHAKKDIPDEIAHQQKRFPHVEVKLGRPIGVNDQMVDLLLEKMTETGKLITQEDTVLLIGRGSSDSDVKRDLSLIGEKLKQKAKIKKVEVCFLAAARPTLQEGLKIVQMTGANQVFIIPYLFFTGVLMKKVQAEIQKVKDDHGTKWILCNYLGYHPIIENIIMDQIQQLLDTRH
ncbi:sirohydrochlorin chelatase [Niallia sp. Krafla_26]|uniref:sirohydrochlorin chelatase n=1 Tax=Niallia sp. Krafla_26 TaxID=3064703 RepID=UPI003D1696F8